MALSNNRLKTDLRTHSLRAEIVLFRAIYRLGRPERQAVNRQIELYSPSSESPRDSPKASFMSSCGHTSTTVQALFSCRKAELLQAPFAEINIRKKLVCILVVR